jgi:D-3-phosphoglycerate dehydrogenase / 2-oxoglutarate reductase
MAELAVRRLEEVGPVSLGDLSRDELREQISEFEVVWVRLRHQVDEELIAAAPRLRVLATPTTGLNHLDLVALERRGITVVSLRGETEFLRDVRATAEHTVALMLAVLRRLPAASEHVRKGEWNRDLFRGTEIFGKMVGIIGFGRLGRLVAEYLAAFGAMVIVCDPSVDPKTIPSQFQHVDLEDVLARSDILTLHASVSRGARPILGAEEFRLIRRGAVLINTARGELIDEAALVQALKTGRLRGAGVDVLSSEGSVRVAEHPLVRLARERADVVVTPHIGGGTEESLAKAEIFLADKVKRLLLSDATGSERRS